MADIRTELARLYPPLPNPPANYQVTSIEDLYQEYLKRLEGRSVTDPLGREVFFYQENFPHLVKLEFFNNKTKSWVEAMASVAMEQLRDKKLDETRYRIGDSSRPRTLFWVPDVLMSPDQIFDNKRNNGTEVYVKRYKRTEGAPIKVALVGSRSDGSKVIVTSFWTDDAYIKGCVKTPAKHSSPK